MRRDTALLERRMRGGRLAEKRPAQKRIMVFTSIGLLALLVVPALDYRCGWSVVPLAGVIAGNAFVAIGFFVIFLVYRENAFTAATIQLAEGQKVVSARTGVLQPSRGCCLFSSGGCLTRSASSPRTCRDMPSTNGAARNKSGPTSIRA